MTSHLDLLTDEPLELAVALRRLAENKAGEAVVKEEDNRAWAKFAEHMAELVNWLKALNEPRPR